MTVIVDQITQMMHFLAQEGSRMLGLFIFSSGGNENVMTLQLLILSITI